MDPLQLQRGGTLIKLREMVLRGEFPPGQRILEVPLAKLLGVSRTPIRLALEQLAHEGLLESAGIGSGFTVREFTLRDLWDGLEARGVLEGAAARLAAERLTDLSELDVMMAIHEELERIAQPYLLSPTTVASGDDVVRYGELNGAFHSALVDLAKSPMLRWTLNRLQTIPFAAPTVVVMPKPGAYATSQDHHRAILEALGNRESTRAEMLMREHARFARRLFELALRQPNETVGSMPGAALIKTEPDHGSKDRLLRILR
jgi:GntR family transcriptional regulator, vanillate catabolism transcriptional regulator